MISAHPVRSSGVDVSNLFQRVFRVEYPLFFYFCRHPLQENNKSIKIKKKCRNLYYVFIKTIDKNLCFLYSLHDSMTERVILESEVFMTDTKKNTLTILAVVLTIAVIFSACTSIFTAKAVYDLRAEAKAQTETQEDGVVILDQYEIVSTLPISEAYRSGNTNGLSAKDKETLELASAVLKEIITEDMTPYEKEKAVYDWMAKELSYDTGALQVVPQTSADCDNPYGTLKYHNAVCVGYATTFRLFMQMLDIPCMVVHNTERYHSWNLVQIEGNWYHVDIYSDQGVGSYANFNMNDELAAVSHDWDRDFFPAATSLEYNYAYQNRVSVKDIYQIPGLPLFG